MVFKTNPPSEFVQDHHTEARSILGEGVEDNYIWSTSNLRDDNKSYVSHQDYLQQQRQ